MTLDRDDDMPSNPSPGPSLGDLIDARISRRGALKGLLTGSALAGAAGPFAGSANAGESSLRFQELPHVLDQTHHVAPGHKVTVLIRWGDRVLSGAPDFDPNRQTAAAQAQQFGYNNDFVAFMPLPLGSQSSDRGLLWVNHEYTNPQLMFSGYADEKTALAGITRDQNAIEMAAHGASIIEIVKESDGWKVVEGSPYSRRITAGDTMVQVSGPVAGHARLKTAADPTGTRVVGTFNNCGGGTTPWGTVLTAEENFSFYFGGDPDKTAQAAILKRYGIGRDALYPWWRFHDRFNVEKEPNEANRYGWVVEVDPYDPQSVPVKRTALGRFKHEAATTVVNKDGRVVVYSGDDERFDYIYRFVTAGRYDPANRAANRDLLDSGTLSVARLDADGRLEWLPLVFGQGPLTPANGFAGQADVLIEARRAGDLLGATKMDRPEDVETNPVTGAVAVMLTNNSRRLEKDKDAANPRGDNRHGHIINLIPPGGRGADADHAADRFTWEIFLLAGNPAREDGAVYGTGTTANGGWLSCPDNVCFDPKGRMWILTDGAQGAAGIADGIWATDPEGPARAQTRRFFAVPTGAELCGGFFTPDGKTLFLAVQHPGEDKDSSFDKPSTRWPDFKAGMPMRPAVVAITREDGTAIG